MALPSNRLHSWGRFLALWGHDMTVDEHQRMIDELQAVLDDTRAIMESFEATGMDKQMPEDYDELEAIATQVVKNQRRYVLQMLDLSKSSHPMSPESL